MPVLTKGALQIDVMEAGTGPALVLLHSSASGAHQWQALTALMQHRRVIAPNLYGYGGTSPWIAPAPQTIADQAALVLAVLEDVDGPVDLVGHSFGALIALEVAIMLGGRAGRLVMHEPNPFALLNRPGHEAAHMAAQDLHRHVRAHYLRGDWRGAASRFADFFLGPGAWQALPEARRVALAASLGPNLHEWDAVTDPGLRPDRWAALRAPALLTWARDTAMPLRVLAQALLSDHPSWQAEDLPRGGHMAPLTRPRVFNDLVRRFLAND
jgi:pimeloyl-ACP methyl ester carboxylesterase